MRALTAMPARIGDWGRLVRLAFKAAAALAVAWVGLMLLHLVVPPTSTLILFRHLTGEPVAREWRDISSISPELVRAVVASEDQRFCEHNGVDWQALGEVLADEDGPGRGASTITMQTVKNLYLWHGRSYVRKALEIPMAVMVDLVWSKQRVMEVYLNVAEWGDGVFGAEAAAQRYFGKPARALNGAEAARLAAALPNPRMANPRAGNGASRRITQRMSGLGDLADCAIPGR